MPISYNNCIYHFRPTWFFRLTSSVSLNNINHLIGAVLLWSINCVLVYLGYTYFFRSLKMWRLVLISKVLWIERPLSYWTHSYVRMFAVNCRNVAQRYWLLGRHFVGRMRFIRRFVSNREHCERVTHFSESHVTLLTKATCSVLRTKSNSWQYLSTSHW